MRTDQSFSRYTQQAAQWWCDCVSQCAATNTFLLSPRGDRIVVARHLFFSEHCDDMIANESVRDNSMCALVFVCFEWTRNVNVNVKFNWFTLSNHLLDWYTKVPLERYLNCFLHRVFRNLPILLFILTLKM